MLAGLSLPACSGDNVGTGTDSETTSAVSASETSDGASTDVDTTTSDTTEGPTSTGPTGTMSAGETSSSDGTTDDSDSDPSTTGPVEPFCGDANVDPDEECDDGNENDFDGCRNDCTEVELLDPPELEWEYYEIEGTACLNGSTAGFGISHNPDSDGIMIYLEGGGACFNDACDFTAFSLPFVPPIDGIFNRNNDSNPVRNWTMVYVPYCTGDIYSGDNEYELAGDLRFFHGYSNVRRFLEVLVPSFEKQRVLLTGISAGGFGAALNTTQAADAYGDSVTLTVIDDSGPPLSNDVIAPCLQDTFREVWGLDHTVLAQCPECDEQNFASGLMEHVLTNYPNVRFGLYSNIADQIIRTYMGFGWGNGQHNNCEGIPTSVPISAYSGDLDMLQASYLDEASTFYRTGLGHTVLRVGYYSTMVDGKTVPQWVGDVLDGTVTHVGP